MSVIMRYTFRKEFNDPSFVAQLGYDLQNVFKSAFIKVTLTLGVQKDDDVIKELDPENSDLYKYFIKTPEEFFFFQLVYESNDDIEIDKFLHLREVDVFLSNYLPSASNAFVSRRISDKYSDNGNIYVFYDTEIKEVNELLNEYHFTFDFVADIQNNEDYNLEEALNYHLNEDLKIDIDNYKIEKMDNSNDLIVTINNEKDALLLTDKFITDTFIKYGLSVESSTRDTVTTNGESQEKVYIVGLIGTSNTEPVLVTQPVATVFLEIALDFEQNLETEANAFDKYFVEASRIESMLNTINLSLGKDYTLQRTLPTDLDFKLLFTNQNVKITDVIAKIKFLIEIQNENLQISVADNNLSEGKEVIKFLISKKSSINTTTVITEETTLVTPTQEYLTFSFLYDTRVITLFEEDKIKGIEEIQNKITENLKANGFKDFSIERKTVYNFKLRVNKQESISNSVGGKNVLNIIDKIFVDSGLRIIRLEVEGNSSVYRVTTQDIYLTTEDSIKKVPTVTTDLNFDLFKVTSFELRETQDDGDGQNNSISFEFPRVTNGIGEFAIFYSKMNFEKVSEYIKDWVIRDFQAKDIESRLSIVSWQYADGAETTFRNVTKSIEGEVYGGKGDYYFYVATLDNAVKPINNGKVLALVGESNSFAVTNIVLQSGREEIEDFKISFFPPKNTALIKQYVIFYSLYSLEKIKDYVYDFTLDYWNELADDESALIVPTSWADGKAISLKGLDKTIEGKEFKRHEIYNFYIASLNHFYLDIAVIKANPIGVIIPKTTPKIERNEVRPVRENVTTEVIGTTVYVEKIVFSYDAKIKDDVLYAIADEIDGILHWTFKAQNNQYVITKGTGNDFEIEFKPIAQQIVARLLNILPSKLDEYELDFVRSGQDKTVRFDLKAKAIIINEPTLISNNVYFDEEYHFIFEFDRNTMNDKDFDILRRVDDTIYDKIVVPDRDNFSTRDYDWERLAGNSFEIIAKNRKMFDRLFDKDFFEDIFYSFDLNVKIVKQSSASRLYEVSLIPSEEEKDRAEQLNKIDALASSIARIENMLLNFLQKTTETK